MATEPASEPAVARDVAQLHTAFQRYLAVNLRKLRRLRAWNQQEAAGYGGLAMRMYQALESGRANPTLSTLAKLCRAFDVRPQELLEATPQSLARRPGRPRGATAAHAASRAEPERSRRILLVEGHDPTRHALQSFLDREGYRVTSAATASEGLAHVRDQTFDVMVCSDDLPDHPGSWLLARVGRRTPETPVVVAAAEPDDFSAHERRVVLRRPLDVERLRTTVDEVMAAAGRASRRKGASPAPSPRTAKPLAPKVRLVLYVTDASPASRRAGRNLLRILSDYDPSQVELRVCNLDKEPSDPDDRVAFTPVLVRRDPAPRAWLLGDLSDKDAVTSWLLDAGVSPIR